MVEFIIIFPIMFFLIFGAIQFALIFHAKITLNYAAYEATRSGTLNNGKFKNVKEGFARGLAPLYSYFDPDIENRPVDGALDQIGAFQDARDKVFEEFDSHLHIVRVERLSPRSESFDDFAPDSDIPNDNLKFRSSDKGKKSNVSIQDANLLRLRFTYWYPLYVPVVNKFIFKLVCSGTTWNTHPVCLTAKDSGDKEATPRIPLTSVAALRMQTPVEKSEGYFSKN